MFFFGVFRRGGSGDTTKWSKWRKWLVSKTGILLRYRPWVKLRVTAIFVTTTPFDRLSGRTYLCKMHSVCTLEFLPLKASAEQVVAVARGNSLFLRQQMLLDIRGRCPLALRATELLRNSRDFYVNTIHFSRRCSLATRATELLRNSRIYLRTWNNFGGVAGLCKEIAPQRE